MLTAVTQTQSVVQGLLSADDYIAKPFVPEELLVRIQKILRQRQDMLAQANENAALHDMVDLIQRDLQAANMRSETESILRRELLHNVTTHLQSLSAIVEAEIRKLPPGIEREAVQRIRGRVRGAAMVYQVSEALGSDPAPIGEIVRMTASALKSIYRPWKRITMTVKGEPTELPAATAAPLAMVVNELVTNCFKHAFPENRFGAITIEYALDQHEFWLVVADDGVGLPLESAGGSGRATVTQLVQALQGIVEWQSDTVGTRVSLRLPISS
jgi:two-component sensor histidine kinase